MQILLAPHVSEKSTLAADQANQHLFKVRRDANKTEIKQAVEFLFDVKVTAVRVMNVKGKLKGFKQSVGRRSDWKKAYVTLAAGNDIQLAGVE